MSDLERMLGDTGNDYTRVPHEVWPWLHNGAHTPAHLYIVHGTAAPNYT